MWRTWTVVLAASVGLSGAAVAQVPDPLASIADADPSELARVALRIGDDAVLERLAGDHPEAVRLAAARATRFLVGPELAVAPLTELAAGRHPSLAPAGAAALIDIAERLSLADLQRREFDPSRLEPALERLDALAADETARGDLRAVGQHVARQLRAMLGR